MSTHRYGTSVCRKCGASFASSPSGVTVHCPACRGRTSAKAAASPYAPAPEGATCTVRSAVSGVCGAPAVRVLVGTAYAECSDHAIGGAS